MAVADRERWDARHAAAGAAGAARNPAPPDALRGREALLPPGGRALDLACGRGTVAVWLAARGFAVDAVDVSPVALDAGRALADREGVGERVRWWPRDLDAGLPGAGPYDVVVCQRFRDPARYPDLAARLVPGGLLVVTVLSQVGEGPGQFRAPAGELRAAFGHLEVLHHLERDGEASLVARAALTSGSWSSRR
ncbi:bifunctional 2-polyprenyl-6-hydroxyphenol methylase/3-demethylubiquinol 3-O-methyltransferase UbiG [Pseudonocardia sp. MH-G8]|uniref:class I SAM-dependent methyltransferase n=1 Tax=Pseudonocardia sp. MH-G8 TaxID=1854588 RepID=UPI000BA12413|nr:methyltransferase domain-containing protein [Pseudonocardia sp. MH-G8]OZM81697.1 SAM-dependent methyltransferase [Pseudonocardia sp. MH-G8]